MLIHTDQVPPGDRLEFVQDLASTIWVPMEIRPAYQGVFRGQFRASALGPMQVVVMDVMPATVRRTPKLISQADPDMLKLVLLCGAGTAVVEQGGRQARLSPGDVAFYDTRRPYEVSVRGDLDRPLRAMTFMFSPSLLPLAPSALARLAAQNIPATAGLGDLTAQFLLQLARNIDHYSPAEAARLSTAALEVLATRLAHELDAGNWETPEARRQALLTTVQGFIQQNLADPRLSPAAIAAANHMSLRSLHQLFHDAGLTVAGWIRQRRLQACRRDLADPTLDPLPVAAIAARWGYSSASDFSRAFRAAHGLPPAEYRRTARVRKPSALPADGSVVPPCDT